MLSEQSGDFRRRKAGDCAQDEDRAEWDGEAFQPIAQATPFWAADHPFKLVGCDAGGGEIVVFNAAYGAGRLFGWGCQRRGIAACQKGDGLRAEVASEDLLDIPAFLRRQAD